MHGRHVSANREEAEVLQRLRIKEADVMAFAKKFNTHPAIIIGRLQHEKLVPYSLGRQFFEPVEFE